jgi:hypothetical protein
LGAGACGSAPSLAHSLKRRATAMTNIEVYWENKPQFMIQCEDREVESTIHFLNKHEKELKESKQDEYNATDLKDAMEKDGWKTKPIAETIRHDMLP